MGGNIRDWFAELSDRLRRVRVVCGDWKRVCGGEWRTYRNDTCGMFFDPPYGAAATRDKRLYRHDSENLAGEVREWCLARGEDCQYRIVLAGYYEEHVELLNHGWTVERWSTRGGYGNQNSAKNVNRWREALFYSPHCQREPDLFEATA